MPSSLRTCSSRCPGPFLSPPGPAIPTQTPAAPTAAPVPAAPSSSVPRLAVTPCAAGSPALAASRDRGGAGAPARSPVPACTAGSPAGAARVGGWQRPRGGPLRARPDLCFLSGRARSRGPEGPHPHPGVGAQGRAGTGRALRGPTGPAVRPPTGGRGWQGQEAEGRLCTPQPHAALARWRERRGLSACLGLLGSGLGPGVPGSRIKSRIGLLAGAAFPLLLSLPVSFLNNIYNLRERNAEGAAAMQGGGWQPASGHHGPAGRGQRCPH